MYARSRNDWKKATPSIVSLSSRFITLSIFLLISNITRLLPTRKINLIYSILCFSVCLLLYDITLSESCFQVEEEFVDFSKPIFNQKSLQL